MIHLLGLAVAFALPAAARGQAGVPQPAEQAVSEASPQNGEQPEALPEMPAPPVEEEADVLAEKADEMAEVERIVREWEEDRTVLSLKEIARLYSPYEWLDTWPAEKIHVQDDRPPPLTTASICPHGTAGGPLGWSGWTRVRARRAYARLDAAMFDVPFVMNEDVMRYLDFFTGPGRGFFARWLVRSHVFAPMIDEILEKMGLPKDLKYVAMAESGFNPQAMSRAGAVGMWQFIRSTGRLYGLKGSYWYDERRNPEKSTDAAARHLKDLYERFDGSWYLAWAAYNGGAMRVSRAIEAGGTEDYWDLCEMRLLPKETCGYVPKILALALLTKSPESYGFDPKLGTKATVFGEVDVAGGVDIAAIARACGASYRDIRMLNPELGMWSTPPEVKTYNLRVPTDKVDAFKSVYDASPDGFKVTFHRHVVKFGETPSTIAKKFRLSTYAVMDVAGISKPSRLRAGKVLMIPVKPGFKPPAEPAGGPTVKGGREKVEELKEFSYSDKKKIYYKIAYGDNLGSIASFFKVEIDELRQWNGIAGNKIYTGEVLQLYVKKDFDTSKAVLFVPEGKGKGNGKGKAREAVAAEKRTAEIVYEIKSGDTLWAVSNKFGVPVAEIKKMNKIKWHKGLQVGQKIRLKVMQEDARSHEKK